jgi:hypothetical protein
VLYVLVVFVLYIKSGRNGDGLPVSKRKKQWLQTLILNSLICLPLPLFFSYRALGEGLDAESFFLIMLAISVFAICYEFFYCRQKLNQLSTEADNLFRTFKVDRQKAKYRFSAEDAHTLVHNDVALNSRYNGINGIQIDRFCKNSSGEYFLVRVRTRATSKPEIRLFPAQEAMNYLKPYPMLYQQEFTEEPYNKVSS